MTLAQILFLAATVAIVGAAMFLLRRQKTPRRTPLEIRAGAKNRRLALFFGSIASLGVLALLSAIIPGVPEEIKLVFLGGFIGAVLGATVPD